MPVFRVYNNRVVFEHNPMFVRSASSAELGAFGPKKTPVAGKSHFDRFDLIEGIKPDVVSGPHKAQFDSSFKFKHFGKMSLPIKAFNLGFTDQMAYELFINGQCEFEYRDVDPGTLVKLLAKRPRLTQTLNHQKRLRIITSVLWMKSLILNSDKDHDFDVEGNFSLGLDAGGKAKPSGKGKGLTRPKGKGTKKSDSPFKLEFEGKDSGGDERKLVFDYAPDSIFAYGMHKVVWDKKNRKKRSRIVNLKPDWQGVN